MFKGVVVWLRGLTSFCGEILNHVQDDKEEGSGGTHEASGGHALGLEVVQGFLKTFLSAVTS